MAGYTDGCTCDKASVMVCCANGGIVWQIVMCLPSNSCIFSIWKFSYENVGGGNEQAGG